MAVVRFFLKLIGVLGAVVVALALAEVAVRLLSPQEVGPVRFACDPKLGNIPVPGQQGVGVRTEHIERARTRGGTARKMSAILIIAMSTLPPR